MPMSMLKRIEASVRWLYYVGRRSSALMWGLLLVSRVSALAVAGDTRRATSRYTDTLVAVLDIAGSDLLTLYGSCTNRDTD